jgi:hypothetical protein
MAVARRDQAEAPCPCHVDGALLRTTCLQGIEVSLGVQPVLPLLVEDDLQAFTHRVAAEFGPAGPLDGSVRPPSDAAVRPSMTWRTVDIPGHGATPAPPPARAVRRRRASQRGSCERRGTGCPSGRWRETPTRSDSPGRTASPADPHRRSQPWLDRSLSLQTIRRCRPCRGEQSWPFGRGGECRRPMGTARFPYRADT